MIEVTFWEKLELYILSLLYRSIIKVNLSIIFYFDEVRKTKEIAILR